MKENKLPYENCTREEAVEYLKTHIENQNEVIEKLTKENEDAHKASETKAYCVNRAVDMLKEKGATAQDVLAYADVILEYVRVKEPKEAIEWAKSQVANINAAIQGNA